MTFPALPVSNFNMRVWLAYFIGYMAGRAERTTGVHLQGFVFTHMRLVTNSAESKIYRTMKFFIFGTEIFMA